MPGYGQRGFMSRAGRESGKFTEMKTGWARGQRPEAEEVSGQEP